MPSSMVPHLQALRKMLVILLQQLTAFFKCQGEAAYHLLPFAISLRTPFLEFIDGQLSATSM